MPKESPDIIPLLQAAFDYDPETGWLTYTRARSHVMPGARAGYLHTAGYRRVEFQGKRYREHRVIFAIVTGRWPTAHIDHENTHKDDNRWKNIREATPSQNNANTNPTTGLKGVDFHKSRGRWRARIRLGNGKRRDLGHFDTPEAAHEAYKVAAIVEFGEFARFDHAYLD